MGDARQWEALSEYNRILNDPEYKRLVAEGKINPMAAFIEGSGKKAVWNNQITAGALDAIKKAQKKESDISVLWETMSGNAPDKATIDKYFKYADDPAMLQTIMQKQAATTPAIGKYNDVVNSTIQDKLGRAATQAELGFFGKQMEQGAVDPYTLQQFIENTNEYQTKASETARGKLATELAGYDKPYMEQVGKQLEAKYSAQGRPGAGAFGSALIKAGQELARGRGEYLSGLGYQDFLRGQGNLRSDYENRLSQMYGQQQQAAQLAQESRNRYYSTQDFERQLAAQERLARLNQPKSQSFLQSMAPGLLQAGLTVAGTALAGPAGGASGAH